MHLYEVILKTIDGKQPVYVFVVSSSTEGAIKAAIEHVVPNSSKHIDKDENEVFRLVKVTDENEGQIVETIF